MKFSSSFGRLMLVELEAYWNFPVFELVLFTALLSVLSGTSSLQTGYFYLNQGFYQFGILLQILIIGIIVPRSFAGSISSRQLMVWLSYPTKRWKILLSKLVANFLVLAGTLAFAVLINSALMGVSFLEPGPYVLIAVVAILVMFWCAISMFISVMVKNEAVSVFGFLLLMFGLEFNPLATSGAYASLTQLRSNMVLYNYLTSLAYGTRSIYTFQDFTTALVFPLAISLVLILFSVVYFEKVLQID